MPPQTSSRGARARRARGSRADSSIVSTLVEKILGQRPREEAPPPYLLTATLFLAPAPAWRPRGGGCPQVLGLPVEIWKLANLLLILGFLVYFLGRPFSQHFRKRREDLDDALDRATAEREKALALASEMTARLATLEKEIAEIRRRGAEDGER
jgi:hypothetical protein